MQCHDVISCLCSMISNKRLQGQLFAGSQSQNVNLGTNHYLSMEKGVSRSATFKSSISQDPDNLQLHCFLGLGTLFCCSFLLFSRPTMCDVKKNGGATFPLLQLVAELRRNQRVRSDVSI